MRVSGRPVPHSHVELMKVNRIQFGVISPNDVIRMSIGKIDSERIYDERGCPTFEGINDPRMGTMKKTMHCYTCKGCHFGHIELAEPVYHYGFLDFVLKTLRCVCKQCHKLLAPRDIELRKKIKNIKNNKGRFNTVFKLASSARVCKADDGGCNYVQPSYHKNKLTLIIKHSESDQAEGQDSNSNFPASEALKILEHISGEDLELLGFNQSTCHPSWMIIKNLLVAPPPVRPSVAMGGNMRSEDDLTTAYMKIIKFNNQLRMNIERGVHQSQLNDQLQFLQYAVATLMDNQITQVPTQTQKNGKPLKAIRSRLKGKEGRLRGNLMGKRVDFSARTVITPDPNLQLDQLGVPQAIAMNMTIPETVTSENIDRMRELTTRGPNQWPGAKYIIRHDNAQVDLSALRKLSDAHIEVGYTIERHITDGDYVLFNRQPSLHKMSIMGHRIKVLPYNTFRLNLSVTSPYNADFDGDEMNMHVPQSYETKAEVKEIMAVPKQIVSPQSNKPVMGIVQDSLLGIMLMTSKDTFIEIDTVMNLLMWVGNWDGQIPTPCIFKPKPLWSGKQILSMIIPKVNFQKYTEEGKDNWCSSQDKNILISKGELLCGVVQKGTVGSAPGGLVHIVWKDLGPDPTRDMLSNIQTVVNNWLVNNGFTVGVQDIIAQQETLDNIKLELTTAKAKVSKIILKAQLGVLKCQPGKDIMGSFEASVNKALNKARDDAGNKALKDLEKTNKIKNMVTAGSKGSNINISQIMACVGQQNVEGKRIPFGFLKRSLPHFSKDDFGPESKGFVDNSYLSGLTPQEFYFHAMGGREGLIDTAVKTSETGYIQRRLIKALEDVSVRYDSTVRNSNQHVVQFLYGEDGMAGEFIENMNIGLLKAGKYELDRKCKFIPDNLRGPEKEDYLKSSLKESIVKEMVNDPSIEEELNIEFKRILEDQQNLRKHILMNGDDYIHLPLQLSRIIWNAKQEYSIKPDSKSDLNPKYAIQSLQTLCNDLSVFPGYARMNENDKRFTREANENCTMLIKIYIRFMLCTKQMIQVERMSQAAFELLLGEIKNKFEQSLSNPGEMIGSIAAQSIGEPATQMTLNTFHLAGVSDKNVTLGVPRLKEIINVAKNIKTPSLTVYLKKEFRQDQTHVMKIQSAIEYTTLSNVVDCSGIYYDPDLLNTIIEEDKELVESYIDIIDHSEMAKLSPWVLRIKLDQTKMDSKGLRMQEIDDKIRSKFGDRLFVQKSDDNAESQVIRIRFKGLDEENEQSVDQFIKEVEDGLLNELALRGFPEIQKVYSRKYNEVEYDEKTGELSKKNDQNWLIETDGCALKKVLAVEMVDPTRTVSNNIMEIFETLGIEAVRKALINELRVVLNVYDIYINYRHLSTLCDVMTQRGKLTSITRHGINRVDSGALRKCSFEETVEILVEACAFSEVDRLKGVTENIIMGQLAPLGTGSFNVMIDQKMLLEHSQQRLDPFMVGDQETPVDLYDQQPNFSQQNTYMMQGFGTPIAPGTPDMMYPGMSERGSATPYDQSFGFSPAPFAGSPAYMASPISPGLGGSPAYNGGMMASPIYNPATGQSPIYSSQPGASPGGASPYVSHSPGGNRAISPSYSPAANANYSPTGTGACKYPFFNKIEYATSGSPVYNPGGSSSYSPSYSPTNSGVVMAHSPRYQAAMSPRYSVDSGMSGGSGASPGSPSYNPSQVYIPSSPAYNPSASPAYYVPSYPGAQPGHSPINDEEEKKNDS